MEANLVIEEVNKTFKLEINSQNITVYDSYQLRGYKNIEGAVQEIVDFTEDRNINSPLRTRSKKSVVEEWAAHNFLYILHIARTRTQHCDINLTNPKFVSFSYKILAFIYKIFH